MNNKNNKELRSLGRIITLAILSIILVIFSFIGDESLKITKRQTTIGTITDITDISRRYKYTKQYAILKNPYNANIVIKYEVDGTQYYKKERKESYYPFNSYNNDYRIGDKVKIVYNKDNPNESAIDELKMYEIIIWIIAIIEIIIIINILYKKVKNS